MKNRLILVGMTVALVSALALGGCGKTKETVSTDQTADQTGENGDADTSDGDVTGDVVETADGEEAPDGYYFNELTHELTDISLKDQRPVAVMVDNESIALPHYGLTQADVVYEMVNSTANGRITRLMCLVKDWEKLEQFGSIRSTRPTNVILASEWNAILCHDGGPFYIDEYLAQPFAYHLSGGFSRVPNGKAYEYTEYICKGDLESRVEKSDFGRDYDKYYNGDHFQFASESYYSEYGKAHLDPQNDNAQLCFKNVIIQSAGMNQLDEHGYMVYDVVGSGEGYYITNGKAEPITWKKKSIEGKTTFYDESGNEITINTGKTYIAIVPSDSWSKLVIE